MSTLPLMLHNGNVLMMQLAMLSAPPPVTPFAPG
jgi:hypothetical protein